MSRPIVDIHCHTFNGDDLPVRGFIERVATHDAALGRALAPLVDSYVQRGAPGYQEENARLDALLTSPDIRGIDQRELVRLTEADPMKQLEIDAEEELKRLQEEDSPQLIQEIDTAMQAAYPSEARDPDVALRGFGFGMVLRAIRWALLFGRFRLELTQLLMATIGDRVDLFCPLSVDLGTALADEAETTGLEQVGLQEKISRLSMLGLLPNASKARVHPFVAFDPMREVRARAGQPIESPLALAQRAVRDYGFIGVKLYPPMGWRPIGNADLDWVPKPLGEELDKALRAFYEWCEEEDVPVTAHCNRSNFASERVADLAAPQGWIDALTEYPKLHLNLGHFGGVYSTDSPELGHDWPIQIARATRQFDHLYVDVGNHAIYDTALMAEYKEQLTEMFANPETEAVKDRIMFGSDWYMEALHPEADRFLTEYEDFFSDWGPELVEGFLGGRAMSFLGFDNPMNQNTGRLRKRYTEVAEANMPAWLAAPPTP